MSLLSPSARTLANAIRMLSADAVQRANSGHPGMPMGMADIAQVLWMDFLRHNPNNPRWHDRDRFVLSNGHGSMLLYSLLHLTGYELPMEQLRRFRQLGSMTPGHPEFAHTPGVETTTGPLGQGLANAVGMALAERTLGAHFNRPGHKIVDHHTYVFVGDGCLMEGISHEASSLAGTLGLGKLVVFYDDNGISIDGEVRDWFTDNTPARFEAYGWHVLANVDGHDSDAVRAAIESARGVSDRPSLICCKTIIGFGSTNKQGKESCHGAPLGHDELALVRERLDWPYPPFVVPDAIYSAWDARTSGAQMEEEWQQGFALYRAEYPDLAAEFMRRMDGELSTDWDIGAEAFIHSVDARAESIATRKASQQALDGFGPMLPEMIGGSADLRDSNLTAWSGSSVIGREQWEGNYILYGVREFAMTAISNGLALHGGMLPYAATFLVFSEYARNALRMAALMGTRSVFVFTHDSIGLGEDGPTHQAVEQAATLRLIPRMSVWRPCDAVETAVAWRAAVERRAGPTCLLLSRQNVRHMARSAEQIQRIRRGGYILMDCEGTPQAVLIATGSEVSLAMDAAARLSANGRRVRVVSMPSTDVFDAQSPEYQRTVLPPQIPVRVAIEAGVTDWWRKYVGLHGVVVGIDDFGVSAPASDAFAHFDLSVERIVARVESKLEPQTAREPAVAD